MKVVKGRLFDHLVICFSEESTASRKLQESISEAGALIVQNINRRVNFFVCPNEEASEQAVKAKQCGVALINVEYFTDCLKRGQTLPTAKYTHVLASTTTAKKRPAPLPDSDDDDEPPAKKKKLEEDWKKGEAASGKAANKSGKQSILKKGSVPVDPNCAQLVPIAHVLEEPGCVWSCTLNQTNITGGNNNNKFYTFQLLEADAKGKWWLWSRWGRVGVTGSSSLVQFNALMPAKKDFEKKFRSKTKNDWSNRLNFKSHPGSYTLLGIDYGSDDEASEQDDDVDMPDSKLCEEIQRLIKLICDVSTMKKSMIEMDYDADKMPLGKIDRVTLQQAYKRLSKLEKLIEAGGSKSQIAQLSSEFYTFIPTKTSGMKKLPLIDHDSLIGEKTDLLQALGNVEIFTTAQKTKSKSDVNPIDAHFEKLNVKLKPVERDDPAFKTIEKSVKNTHAKTHTDYTLVIRDIFEVSRKEDNQRFEEFDHLSNHKLLWHGSRITNWFGILSQGLKIAPPEAPVTGYMFGKGLYFADMVSKSANYCHATKNMSEGCALLCEVALGNMYELEEAKMMKAPPAGFHSTLGAGATTPDPSFVGDIDGVEIPCGKGITSQHSNSALLYNEFIVYNVGQCRMRYLVRFKFNFSTK